MKSHRKTLRDCAAFTLLEALLALLVISLALAVAFSTWQTFERVNQSGNQRESGTAQAVRALNLMVRDLACAVWIDQDQTPFLLAPPDGRNPGSTLEFFTAMPDNNEADPLAWHVLHGVRYHLAEDGRNGWKLLRIEWPMRGPATHEATTNTLQDGVEQFDVAVLHHGQWHTAREIADRESWPQTARISLHVAGSEAPLEVECFLPLGLVVTSRTERAQQARQ